MPIGSLCVVDQKPQTVAFEHFPAVMSSPDLSNIEGQLRAATIRLCDASVMLHAGNGSTTGC